MYDNYCDGTAESARGDCAVVISYHPDLVAIENFERSSGIDKIPNALQYRLTIQANRNSIDTAISRYVRCVILLDEA